MEDIPVKLKRKYLLLFNRIIRRETNTILFKTPTKISDDDVHKVFNQFFEKKEDYYVPKKLSEEIKFNHEEFKDVDARKPRQPKEKKPKKKLVIVINPVKPTRVNIVEPEEGKDITTELKELPKQKKKLIRKKKEEVVLTPVKPTRGNIPELEKAKDVTVELKENPTFKGKNLMMEMVDKFNATKIKNMKIRDKNEREKIESEYLKIKNKIRDIIVDTGDYHKFIKSLPEVLVDSYFDITKYFKRRINANYKKQLRERALEKYNKTNEKQKEEKEILLTPIKPTRDNIPKLEEPKDVTVELKQLQELEGKRYLEDIQTMLQMYKSDLPALDFCVTEFGTRLYMYYVLQKHKNVCISFNNDNINWRFYRGTIYTNYKGYTLEYDMIERDIKECMEDNKRFLAIPFQIHYKEINHQNMLILDLQKYTVERYEPHGAEYDVKKWTEIQDKINVKLANIFDKKLTVNGKKFTYLPPHEICPILDKDILQEIDDITLPPIQGTKKGFQTFETIVAKEEYKEDLGEGGYCVAWSYYYLETRLMYPDASPKEIYKITFTELKSNPKNFLKFIRGYADYLGKFFNTHLNKFIEDNKHLAPVRTKMGTYKFTQMGYNYFSQYIDNLLKKIIKREKIIY